MAGSGGIGAFPGHKTTNYGFWWDLYYPVSGHKMAVSGGIVALSGHEMTVSSGTVSLARPASRGK